MKLKVGATNEPTFEKQVACLDAAITRLQVRAEAERAAYLAWSEGDVRPLLIPRNLNREPGCAS